MDAPEKTLKPEDIAWNNIKNTVINSIIHQYISSKNVYPMSTNDWDTIFYRIFHTKENFKNAYKTSGFIIYLNQDFGIK